jgi:transcriptional regulator with XRE-family HTH domain
MQELSESAAVGQQVTRLRKQLGGLSQVRLAGLLSDLLGKVVDPTTVNRLERGKRPVTVEELVALSQIFGVSFAELLSGPDRIQSVLQHWRGRLKATEAADAIACAQLDELRRQADSEHKVISALSLLDRSRKEFDGAAVMRALTLLIESGHDGGHYPRLRDELGPVDLADLFELAGVSTEVLGAAWERTKQLFADQRRSPDERSVQYLKLILEGLTENGSAT